MDSYLSDIWKRTLTLILEKGKQQEKLDNLIFNQFFSDSKLMDLDEKKALVVVPGYIQQTIMMQNKEIVEEAISEVPERIDGLTGGVAGTPVPTEHFERLTEIPVVLYFGDYIPETPSENLGDENWRVRLQMARKFVETINRHGGNATLVELPKIGIHGNTHFLMQDLNNDELADLLNRWLQEQLLAQ